MYLIVCVSSRKIVKRFLTLAYAKDWLLDNNILDGEPCKLFEIITEAKYHAQQDDNK